MKSIKCEYYKNKINWQNKIILLVGVYTNQTKKNNIKFK